MSVASEDIDVIYAGEVALGVLDADECARAGARMKDDAAFAAMVSEWRRTLAPLSAAISPVAPPPALKKRLAHALFAGEERRCRHDLHRSRGLWRTMAVTAAALAIVAIAALYYVVIS
ncbi:MAG: hypothetical protein AAGA09_06305 [Pseudomonadota bacterium]